MPFGLLAATVLQTCCIFVFAFILLPFRVTVKKSILLVGGVVVALCAVSACIAIQYSAIFLYRYGYVIFGVPSFLVIYLISKARGVRFVFIVITAMIFHQMISSSLMVFRVYNGGSFSPVYFLLNLLLYSVLLVGGLKLRKDFHKVVFTYQAEFCCLCPILLLLFGMMSLFSPVTGPETIDFDLLYLSLGIYLLVILIYLYIAVNFRSLAKNLEAERGALAFQRQIEEAQEHITLLRSFQEKTERQRHDLQHHLGIVEKLLDGNEIQQLREYLAGVQAQLDQSGMRRYCQNEAVDLLLCAVATKAQDEDVVLLVDTYLPQALPIGSAELCALLSNALDNAISAAGCVADGRAKTVSLMAEMAGNKLLIMVENPFAGQVLIEKGLPQPADKDHGFGVKNIVAITEKFGGLFSFDACNGVFTLRIVI